MSKKSRPKWLWLLWGFLAESAVYLCGILLTAYLAVEGKLEPSRCGVPLTVSAFTAALCGYAVCADRTPAGRWGSPLCGAALAGVLLVGNLCYGEGICLLRLPILAGLVFGCICVFFTVGKRKRGRRRKGNL